jgi:GNAT superfamily N-acetyltransferase
MKVRTIHLDIGLIDKRLDARETLDIFNSNPDFVADLEGSGDRHAYSIKEVRDWAWFTGQLRENQRCLGLRRRDSGRLIGVAELLVPHPRGDCAALGLLLVHRDWQGQGLGREAAVAIEETLASEGWKEMELVVQRVRPRSRRFWEACGYRLVREGKTENGHDCWIMRKSITC